MGFENPFKSMVLKNGDPHKIFMRLNVTQRKYSNLFSSRNGIFTLDLDGRVSISPTPYDGLTLNHSSVQKVSKKLFFFQKLL